MEMAHIHYLTKLVKEVNHTHRGLGQLIATNLVAAKARRCILNVSPAGCGKSVGTDTVTAMLGGECNKYTSLTLAGLKNIQEDLNDYHGHIVVDDLGAEKSEWSRTSTVTVLATLVHTHNITKIVQTYILTITNFNGSAALNIQPVLLNQLIVDSDWIAVTRDKVLRYYHLIRPIQPKQYIRTPQVDWSIPISEVMHPEHKGKLWYQLVVMGLTQWSYGRVLEHIPMLLKACAALDGRTHCEMEDYRILIKLLRPMQLERYLVDSLSFEAHRNFDNDLYCILVELASHGTPTIDTICEDYKVSPDTVHRVAQQKPIYCWIKKDSQTRLMPTDRCMEIFKIIGVNQTW